MEDKKVSTDALEAILKGEAIEVVSASIARKRREEKVMKNIMTFIQKNKIEAGSIPVPNHVIYYVYHIIDNPFIKAGYTAFFRQFGTMFQSGRTKKGRFYLLNADFSEEVYRLADNYKSRKFKRK